MIYDENSNKFQILSTINFYLALTGTPISIKIVR